MYLQNIVQKSFSLIICYIVSDHISMILDVISYKCKSSHYDKLKIYDYLKKLILKYHSCSTYESI